MSYAALIRDCLNGDGTAWEALVRRYRRLVFSIPRKWGLSKEDAMEIFQAVWLDCFRELRSLQNVERLQPWLLRIAVRKCHRFSQASRATPTKIPVDEVSSESRFVERADLELIRRVELEQLIRFAVERLSPRCRQVIEALFFEEPLPSYAA